MDEKPDYTRHAGAEDTAPVLDQKQDELAEEIRKMKAVNDQNIDDMNRLAAQQQQQQQQEQEDADQELSDRVVRQQRSESQRILSSAKEQIPAASRQVDKALEQVATTDMQIEQAKLAKYAQPQAAIKQSHGHALRDGVAVGGKALLGSAFKHHHDQVKAKRSNIIPWPLSKKPELSPADEYARLQKQRDEKLVFVANAQALREQEANATSQQVADVRKKMRLLAATELYPNATSKTLTDKQLAHLNGDAGTLLNDASKHAQQELHKISARMHDLEPKLPKNTSAKVNEAAVAPVTETKQQDTPHPTTEPKQPVANSIKPVKGSNKQLGLGNTAFGTATASKSAPVNAKVEKAGRFDKQLEFDDQMHESAGKTAENVDDRVAQLEAQLADAQAENMRLREQQAQQAKRNQASFVQKWKANQAKYAQMSTKSLVAATATRLGKATLKVSAKVIAASLTVIAAAGYMGARKADKMAKHIQSGMDASVLRSVDPAIANQVDLGK